MKLCRPCNTEKPTTAFHADKRRKGGLQSRCKDCQAAWSRDAYARNQNGRADQMRARSIETARRIREQVLAAYEGACACCGEKTPEFLALDHVAGGGRAHRRRAGGSTAAVYRDVLRQGCPADYRLLCHNCNCARGFYGFCPHERNR